MSLLNEAGGAVMEKRILPYVACTWAEGDEEVSIFFKEESVVNYPDVLAPGVKAEVKLSSSQARGLAEKLLKVVAECEGHDAFIAGFNND